MISMSLVFAIQNTSILLSGLDKLLLNGKEHLSRTTTIPRSTKTIHLKETLQVSDGTGIKDWLTGEKHSNCDSCKPKAM